MRWLREVWDSDGHLSSRSLSPGGRVYPAEVSPLAEPHYSVSESTEA